MSRFFTDPIAELLWHNIEECKGVHSPWKKDFPHAYRQFCTVLTDNKYYHPPNLRQTRSFIDREARKAPLPCHRNDIFVKGPDECKIQRPRRMTGGGKTKSTEVSQAVDPTPSMNAGKAKTSRQRRPGPNYRIAAKIIRQNDHISDSPCQQCNVAGQNCFVHPEYPRCHYCTFNMYRPDSCQAGGTKERISSQAPISEKRTGSRDRQGFAIPSVLQPDNECLNRVNGVAVSITNNDDGLMVSHGQQSSNIPAQELVQQPVRAPESRPSGFDVSTEDHAVDSAFPHNIVQGLGPNTRPWLGPPSESWNQGIEKIEALMRDPISYLPTDDDLRGFREGILSEIDSAVKVWLTTTPSRDADFKGAVRYNSSMRLLKRMYSVGANGLTDRITRLSQRCEAGAEVVLRGLIGTTLSDWVFEARETLPAPEEDNDHAHTGSGERRSSLPVLFQLRRQSYQAKIDQLRGEDSSSIEEKYARKAKYLYVKEDLDTSSYARDLALEMNGALRAFIRENSGQWEDAAINKWLKHLTTACEYALKLKLQTSLQPEDFEFRWPRSGEPFDLRWMEAARENPMNSIDEVHFALMPALLRKQEVTDRVVDFPELPVFHAVVLQQR